MKEVSPIEFLSLHAQGIDLPWAEQESLNSLWSLLATSSDELKTSLMNKRRIDEVWAAAAKVAIVLARIAEHYENTHDEKPPELKRGRPSKEQVAMRMSE